MKASVSGGGVVLRFVLALLSSAIGAVVPASLAAQESSPAPPGARPQEARVSAAALGGAGAVVQNMRTLGHRHWVRGFAFSPDGRRLAVATDDGTAVVWDVTAGEPVGPPLEKGYKKESWRRKFRFLLPSFRFSFSADGRFLIWISGQRVAVWDTSTGETVLMRDDLDAAAASPDGSVLALESRDGIVFWDILSRRTRGNPIHGDLGEFSPDGRWLVVGTHTALLLVPASGGQVVTVPLDGSGGAGSWTFSLDGNTLAIVSKGAGQRDVAVLWDVKGVEPSRLATLSDARSEGFWNPAFSSDGKLFAITFLGHRGQPVNVALWDVTATSPVPRLMGVPGGRNPFNFPFPVAYFFCPGTPLLALNYFKGFTMSEANNSLELWDVGGAAPRMVERIPRALPISFTRDGSMLAYKQAGQAIGLWSVTAHKTVASLLGKCPMGDAARPEMTFLGFRTYPSFSSDGSLFACGGWPRPGDVALWDVRDLR